MTPPRRAGLALLLAGLLPACDEVTATQVLVRVGADDATRAAAATLVVRVYDADGVQRYDRSKATADLDFPATVPVVPLNGDASRRFELVAELEDGSGAVFARERVISGFVEDELREVEIRFSAACRDVLDCGATETCVGGSCESACVLPAVLGEEAERVTCPDTGCDPACGPCEACVGGACVTVEDGAACADGTCHAGACCTGCWDTGAETCLPGDAMDACGAGGSACEACCASDAACTSGACDPPQPAGGISAGFDHACVLAGGALYCWGTNDAGQLGDDTMTSSPVPLHVTARDQWGEVSAGTSHTCAIDWENALWCWGGNAYGQLGTGDMTPSTLPVEVSPGSTWGSVAAGASHTCAIDRVGGLWCWGQNADGLVGDTSFGGLVPTPTELLSGTIFSGVSTFRRHACALSGTTLYCWGLNRDGALEVGRGEDGVAGPAEVTLDYVPPVVGFAAGGFATCAITQAMPGMPGGPIRCWGVATGGQLGRPAGALPSDPIGGIEDFVSVSAGQNHACAIRADGSLWCWGRNELMQSAGGAAEVVLTPQRVGDKNDWRAVSAGGTFTCGVRELGTLWCWGDGSKGQLGVAGATSAGAPTRVCIPPP